MKLLSWLSLILISSATFSAQAPSMATRGLENSGLDEYVSILRSGDLKGLTIWFQNSGFSDLAGFVESQSGQEAKTVALTLANRIFLKQQTLRTNRYAFVLLQTLLEETVMYSGVQTALFSGDTQLSPSEWGRAGRIRGVRVLPGDTIVQIGASALSSHFIAHSQSGPGLASHSLLVSKGGSNPEILEALIEDGTNRRDPYAGPLARFFVLSARTEADRARLGEAVDQFIFDLKIPYVVSGDAAEPSPLLYDSTMNPDRKKDGYYFCTALVQEVYSRAQVGVNPFPENKSNWNHLAEGSLERAFYRELNITEALVPAPGDALLNPDMAIRALVLDTAALKASRRLRAVIDTFYDLLQADAAIRNELLTLFRQIPTMELRKREILAAVDRILSDPDFTSLLSATSLQFLRNARQEMATSLPQAANLRQVTFFLIMNHVIQNRAMEELETFETETLKRHALPGELRAAATRMLQGELVKLRAALSALAKISPAEVQK